MKFRAVVILAVVAASSDPVRAASADASQPLDPIRYCYAAREALQGGRRVPRPGMHTAARG